MASSTLKKIAADARIFIDSSIFIYHFTGASTDCRQFLERCERGEVKGISSVVVLAEVAHRLMMIEAMVRGLITGSNLPRKLRDKPELVKTLHTYQEQIERIPLMGIDVAPVDSTILFQSSEFRRRYGLLVNDSLVAASAVSQGVGGIASADADFGRMKELTLFRPQDLLPQE